MSEKSCIICGEHDDIMLHDDNNIPYCPQHFTEHVGYCVVCQEPANIAHNKKNEKGEVFCKVCMVNGDNFAEKMLSIVQLEQDLARYDIKIPFSRELTSLSIEELKEFKFAMAKILSLVAKM